LFFVYLGWQNLYRAKIENALINIPTNYQPRRTMQDSNYQARQESYHFDTCTAVVKLESRDPVKISVEITRGDTTYKTVASHDDIDFTPMCFYPSMIYEIFEVNPEVRFAENLAILNWRINPGMDPCTVEIVVPEYVDALALRDELRECKAALQNLEATYQRDIQELREELQKYRIALHAEA
jgi:hypothetical protein